MKAIFLFFSVFVVASCSNIGDKASRRIIFNAMVLGVGMDCGDTFLIKLYDDASGIPQNTTQDTFYAINLPEEFKVENLEIYIHFRLPNETEILNCTVQDITYPQLYIENVN